MACPGARPEGEESGCVGPEGPPGTPAMGIPMEWESLRGHSLRGAVGEGLAFAPRALPGDSTKPLPGDGDPWVETCCCGDPAEPHAPHAPRDPLPPERGGFLRTAAGRRPVEALYFVHFLSVWGWRGWEFLVVLFLVALTPDSLLTTALFSLFEVRTCGPHHAAAAPERRTDENNKVRDGVPRRPFPR